MWSIFKRKPSAPAAPVHRAPTPVVKPVPAAVPAAIKAAGISYDPQLVAKLKGDHAELFTIFRRLLNAATAAQLTHLTDDLILFRRAFQGHILLENVKFYVYMDRLLAEMPTEREYVHSLRKDMNGIAKAVADFIHTWVTTPPTAVTLPAFTEQLKGVGAALVTRVELEENTLYTLYSERI